MLDRKPNWPMIITLVLTAYLWVNVYYFGFFQTLIWYIVFACIIGICIKVWETRV